MVPTDVIRGAMQRFGVPGVSVGVLHGNDDELAGFGVTSVDNPLEVDGDTLFQVGSITKTFTATAAMRLVEDGLLDLDDPVRKVLPELRLADAATAEAVTMRHLLSHTGGWVGDYFDVLGPGDDALAEMVGHLARLEQLTPLGEVWSYNNSGFYIAGRMIEVLAGKPFEHVLHELVLEPLGLDNSFFFPDDVMTRRFAVGHVRSGAVARPWGIGRPAAPAGGLVASVRELLKYARLQWEPGTFLSRESLAAMREVQAEVVGPADAVGLGWYLFDRGGHSFVTHGGATNGQQALLAVAPEDRFAVAVLTNHDDGAVVGRAVLGAVLQAQLGIEPPAEERIELSADELAEYEGEYESALMFARLTHADGGLTLEVTPRGGFPHPDSPPTEGPPPTRIAFERKDVIVALDPPLAGSRADFLRAPDGSISWFRSGGRVHRRVG